MKKQDIDKLLDKYWKKGYLPNQALSILLKDLKRIIKKKKLSVKVVDYLKNEVLLKQRARIGQYYEPDSLVKFIVDIAPLKKGDVILDPTCGVGSFLIEAGNRKKDLQLFGIDIDPEIIKWAKFFADQRLLDIHYFNQDSLRPFPKEAPKADIIFSSLPFGGRVSDRKTISSFEVKTSSLEGLLIQKIINSLKKGGIAFIIIPNGLLFRKDLLGLRKHIASKTSVLAIIDLPENIFAPYTSIATSILVIKKSGREKETLLFDVPIFKALPIVKKLYLLTEKHKSTLKKRKDTFESIVSDFVKRGNWLVSKYFGEIEIEKLLKKTAKGKALVRLSDITTIESRSLKDLRRGKATFDLLLASRFTPGKIFTSLESLKSKSDKAYYFAVKVKKGKILPRYLEFLLKTRLFKDQTSFWETGLTIRSIPIERLKDIRIPIVSLVKQKKIIDLATKLSSYIDDLKVRIEFIENQLTNNIFEIEKISKKVYQFKTPEVDPFDNLPRMIAIPYRTYKNLTSLDKKYDSLKVCFEVSLKTIGAMILMATKNADEMAKKLAKIKPEKPISNGIWIAVILEGLNFLSKSESFLSSYADEISKDKLKAVLNQLNKLRIDEAHPFNTLNEFQKKELVNQFGNLLEDFIKEFIFLTEYPLVYFQSASSKHGKISHIVEYLIGDTQIPKEEKVASEELFQSELYFLSSKYGKSLLLAPLVIYENCPKCKYKEIFFFDFIEKGIPRYGGCSKREGISFPEYLNDLKNVFDKP